MQGSTAARNREYLAGGLMCVIGASAVFQGMRYQVGTLNEMGPGFFPAAVGVILTLTGIAIAVAGRIATAAPPKRLPPEWKGWFCIAASIVAFVVIGKFGGLLPATVAIVFISALGDRNNTIKSALYLSLAVAVVCIVVFWWALKVQFPLFTWG